MSELCNRSDFELDSPSDDFLLEDPLLDDSLLDVSLLDDFLLDDALDVLDFLDEVCDAAQRNQGRRARTTRGAIRLAAMAIAMIATSGALYGVRHVL